MDLYKNSTLAELLELAQTLRISELKNEDYFDLETRVKVALAGDLGVLDHVQKKELEEFLIWIEFDWTQWRFEDISHRAEQSKLGWI